MKNKGTLLLVGLLFGFTLPIQAHAIIATVTNTFVAGQKIVAQQVNQNFNDILSAINGQLTDQNMSPQGITNVSLASGTVTGPIMATFAAATKSVQTTIATATTALLANATISVTTSGNVLSVGFYGRESSSTFSALAGLPDAIYAATQNPIGYPFFQIPNYRIDVLEDGIPIEVISQQGTIASSSSTFTNILTYPCNSVRAITKPTAGSHTYTVRAATDAILGTIANKGTLLEISCILRVQELPR